MTAHLIVEWLSNIRLQPSRQFHQTRFVPLPMAHQVLVPLEIALTLHSIITSPEISSVLRKQGFPDVLLTAVIFNCPPDISGVQVPAPVSMVSHLLKSSLKSSNNMKVSSPLLSLAAFGSP